MVRRRRQLQTRVRYLGALLRRFRVTVLLAAVLFGLMPLVFVALYRGPHGERVHYGEAFHHVYFLMFGQPSLAYVPSVLIELLNVTIPPLGVAVLADGVVRFAYLFFAKHKQDKEWVEVMSESMRGHVVVCGAGRVGYRVASQLLDLGRELVVIEKREDSPFVRTLRARDVPVLIDDVKNPHALEHTHIRHAAAIVCATDDDLANLNTALDARRHNPEIRVVMRLFDDDLGAKVREAFRAEVLSSSALAAPAMALAALDPRVLHSFHVGGKLMVVSEFRVGAALGGVTVGAVRERFGAVSLCLRASTTSEQLLPRIDHTLSAGETVTLQAAYDDYLKLRAFTNEREPPSSSQSLAPPPR